MPRKQRRTGWTVASLAVLALLVLSGSAMAGLESEPEPAAARTNEALLPSAVDAPQPAEHDARARDRQGAQGSVDEAAGATPWSNVASLVPNLLGGDAAPGLEGDGALPGDSGIVTEGVTVASIVAALSALLAQGSLLGHVLRTVGIGAPLYSRISRSELLENETRADIYETVRAEPGLSMQELADETNVGWGTIVYHLERLEKNDLLVSRKEGKSRRFFPQGTHDETQRERMSLLQRDTPRDLLEHLCEHPGTNQKELAEALDVAPSTVHKYVTRLQDLDLVEDKRSGREVHYYPGKAADEAPGVPTPCPR